MLGGFRKCLMVVGLGFAVVSVSKAETTNPYWQQTFVFGQGSTPSLLVQNTEAGTPPRTEAPPVRGASSGLVVETSTRYIRNPTGGDRTRTITSFGGTAGQQICGGPIEIRNREGICRELDYDRDFLQFFQTEGLRCARAAAEEAFGFTPTQIGFRTGEGQVSASRRSSNGKLSTHALGRALDVFEVEIHNGRAHNTILMHGGHMQQRANRTFYASFRDCWIGAVQGARGTLAGSQGSGCLHYDSNAAHWDHMHISLPPRDEVRRAYGVNST